MKYFLSRFFQGIVTLFGVTLITFILPSTFGEGAYSLAVQVNGPRSTRVENLEWIHKVGLDQPVMVQYWHWLIAALHGDFGYAYGSSHLGHLVTVSTVLSGATWRSIWLTLIPTIISLIVAIPIGLTQATRRNRPYDHIMTTIVYVLYSTPAVLVCIILQFYLAVELHIGTPTIDSLAEQVSPSAFPGWMITHADQFLLPFLAIIALSIGGLSRFMRSSALDTLVQDHVRTARAKGASSRRVLFRHVLRPSIIPLITILGLSVPGIIGGALIVENVFNYPGMGVLAVQSVTINDIRVVMAITVFTAVLTVLGNLLADVMVAVADPRVRLGGGR